MNKQKSNVRIKDIATMAGVSTGTVDRVLHNRGEVSDKSREAVNKVLEEINYSPNLLARSLASKKSYRFVCILPKHESGDYWQSVEDGFDRASQEFVHYNIQIERLYFDQFDVESFMSVWKKMNLTVTDGFVLAPIFRNETLELCKELEKLVIPYSFIDSMIEEANFLSYYGQNSYQSGYVAAKLLMNSLTEQSSIILVRTRRKGSVSNQTKGRLQGFIDFFNKENNFNIKIIQLELSDRDDKSNIEKLNLLIENDPGIKALITFNSKIYRIVQYLHNLGKEDLKIIGYDLLEPSIELLKQDKISYLIGQRPEKQSFMTIRDMCHSIILKQDIRKISYVPIDILMKENIEDYLEFNE